MVNSSIDEVIVSTTNGPIKGQENVSVYGDSYFSFEKIPFATPPLDKLRFKEPQPAAAWTDLLDCTQKPEKPIQKNQLTNEIEGSEDCLYLNVFVKKLKSKTPLPVMVFLFGGGFEKGDPSRDLHGPDYLMMKDVVFITLSYRVGPLGFLSLKDPALNTPGNAGLKDQLLGLKWVKENVANFNGDPNNITLFGESAGAASTHYMMLTPHAQGLFHKAILMSGNVLCPWAMSPLERLPFRLAKANGYDGENSDEKVVEFLHTLKAEDLVRPNILTRDDHLDDCLFSFGPVVEPYYSENCIIPRKPSKLLEGAWGNQIPIMFGGTSFEGLIMYARVHMMPYLLTELKENSQHMLPLNLKRKFDLEKQKALGNKLIATHFGDNDISMATVLKYCDYATYKVFWHPIYRILRMRLRHGAAPSYLYRFDFDSPHFNHQRIKYCGKNIRGVAHVDDHSYLFYGSFSWKLSQDSPEFRTIQRMIDIWTTFAADSNPNCQHTDALNWAPLNDHNNPHCLNIGEELELIHLPELEKLQVWQSLYEQTT